jgi:hypothetical protein
MKESEMLRALAKDLRAEAVKRAEVQRTKAAATLVAAAGLGMLRRKLGGAHG